jgi:deoxyribonuclease V
MNNLFRIQKEIASRVILKDSFSSTELTGGVDQAFFKDYVCSGIVVLDEDGDVMEYSFAKVKARFPYVPGLLAFRELPSILKAYKKLREKPDLLMIDGCGINHPRFAGLASHAGVLLNLPAIGVTKNILCGEVEKEPENVGEESILSFENKKVGFVLLSKKGCRPIIVAPGHKVSLRTSLKIVKFWLRGYKLPEPLRLAHRFVNEKVKEMK